MLQKMEFWGLIFLASQKNNLKNLKNCATKSIVRICNQGNIFGEFSHEALIAFWWWWHHLGLPGWNFTPSSRDRSHATITCGRVIFRPDKVGQFSTWYLFRFVYNFFEFFFVTMSVYETENPWFSINFNFFLLELFRNEKQLFANALQNGIFQSFTILPRKHKCLCISLIKLQTWRPAKRLPQMFSCEYCKIFKSKFFIEHFRWQLLCNDKTLQRDLWKPIVTYFW